MRRLALLHRPASPALVIASLVMLLGLLPASASAQSVYRSRCLEGGGGPRCTFWTAKATFIADGDTIKVKLDSDRSRAVQLVRFTGINAMELHRYSKYASRRRGECHGLDATSLVEHYVRRSHRRILLSAQHPSSTSGGRHRLRRSVWVKVGGQWRDLAKLEMQAGLALWLPNGDEWAHNREYHELAEQAALAQRGLFNPATCGFGPDQDLPISLSVNWDADGNDSANLRGEWVDIHNGGARPLSLAGWWFRDSWLNYDAQHTPGYAFPAGAVVPAFGTIRLHIGCGGSSAGDYYWCQRSDAFENVTHDKRQLGDGGYLFDPQGDLRAERTYPCLVACLDPLAGAVRIGVHEKTPEMMTITNVSNGPVDLGDHVLKLRLLGKADAFIFGVPFGYGTILQPGETMRIDPGDGRDLAGGGQVRHLDRGAFVLADGGGQLTLRTSTDLVTDCTSWGRGHC
jgi:endonuclease YncB( thermonuclease family)